MRFPRLIFANEIPPVSSESEVIADLKLDLIFPTEVSDYLLLKPDAETLLARREMFSALLSDAESGARLEKCAELLGEAEELYKALTAAQSEYTAAYVFPSLMLKVAEFYDSAEALSSYGGLFERFCGTVSALKGREGFSDAVNGARGIKDKLAPCRSLVIKTDGSASTVSASREGGMAEALRGCARELGIPLKERPLSAFVLQKGIAEALGKVYPEALGEAAAFLNSNRTLVTGEIFDYLPEIRFVLGVLEFTKKATDAGIPYSFPTLSEKRGIDLKNVYDVTLLKKEGTTIIPNDVAFDEAEPFFYLTGANGGGKTTYIRAVGGAMLMFLAGMPVFCEGGSASLLSAVFTHFPKDERFEGTGRFLDEKRRVDSILAKQDGNALVLLNETFSTTGEEKAIEQTDILAKLLYRSGCFGLYITHQHDVTEKEIPFLGVTVDEADSNRRTYKIEKRRLPPRSFAKDILEKYGLDKKALRERFGV